MLGSIVYYAICAVFILCAIPIYIKLGKKRRSKNITLPQALLVIFVALLIGLTLLLSICYPIDKLLTFRTPEAAFAYSNFEKAVQVIDGENTVFVRGKSKIDVIFKTEKGYKICKDLKMKQHIELYPEGFVNSIWLLHYDGTDDYYLIIDEMGKNVISDSRHSNFFTREIEDPYLSEPLVTHYVYVKGLDDSYVLYVNNEEYHPSNLIPSLETHGLISTYEKFFKSFK